MSAPNHSRSDGKAKESNTNKNTNTAKILSHPVPGKPEGQWKVQWMIQRGGDFLSCPTLRKETVLIVWFYTKRILDSSVTSVTKAQQYRMYQYELQLHPKLNWMLQRNG